MLRKTHLSADNQFREGCEFAMLETSAREIANAFSLGLVSFPVAFDCSSDSKPPEIRWTKAREIPDSAGLLANQPTNRVGVH